MFEDSTFESNGRVRTRSRGWVIVSLIFDGSILAALVLLPLFYPQALPRQMLAYLMDTPVPVPAQPKPQPRLEHAVVVKPEIQNGHIFAPSVIPRDFVIVDKPEVLPRIDVADLGDAFGPSGAYDPFRGQGHRAVIRPAPSAPVRVSSAVVAGLLVQQIVPDYPPIARLAGVQGTVVLEATISKSGTIENLRVAGGPLMLQQAALNAVRTWRYRPYLLGRQPVAVETTVNVVFTLAR